MSELKFILTGTPGAGKTTAIAAISDFPPISTDMFATDELSDIKETTTVAMDFGQFSLDDGEIIHLYGTPGQERFRHMWEILVNGGLGLIILIDNSRRDPLADLKIYLDNFRDFIHKTGAVIGITRNDVKQGATLDQFMDLLAAENMVLPVMEVDARSRDDVVMMLDILMSIVEVSSINQTELNHDSTLERDYFI